MCRVMRISACGYRSWRSRSASRRTRGDMKVLAHIREHDSLGIAPNLLDGDFAADMPNRKWAGGISPLAFEAKVA